MLPLLKERESQNRPLQIGILGAGRRGRAIARQVARTPGMRLAFVADDDLTAARDAVRLAGREPVETADHVRHLPRHQVRVTTDALELLKHLQVPLDAVVEASNSVGPAAEHCLAAINRPCHVILTNPDVDLAFGPLLQFEAARNGVVVTSDAGDAHGALATMIDEVELWGFRIVQAGTIAGFIDRDATPDSVRSEAGKRDLDPAQCCAGTDGTRLNIEMALVSNGTGLTPAIPGMEGPPCRSVHEILERFDFAGYRGEGHVDYIRCAEPEAAGGAYVVGHSSDPLQHDYLRHYKMGRGPRYLFHRPYHLCHLETIRAIARACLYREPILTPRCGRVSDVYAYAKRDLPAGHAITQAIGGPDLYGLIRVASEAAPVGHVPIALLQAEDAPPPVLTREVLAGEPLRFTGVGFEDAPLLRLFKRQQAPEPSWRPEAKHRPVTPGEDESAAEWARMEIALPSRQPKS